MSEGTTSMRYPDLIAPVHRALVEAGIPDGAATWLAMLTGIVIVFTVMALLSKVLARLLFLTLKRMSARTESSFDDHLLRYRLHRYVARVVPLMASYNLVPIVFQGMAGWIPIVERLFHVFFIVLFVRIARAVLRAARDNSRDRAAFRDKPLDSYVQVITLIMYLVAGVLIFSQLTGQSALTFLTAMGAASAVLLLVFKDTIMGFVASIQISANDMVRVDDWIEMPKYGADGDVTEINLTTVKVRNWDNTITTVPTYALIVDSFKNWRGMTESGGRRIKRSILVKISSIRHLLPEELDHLRQVRLLRTYIDERVAEIARHNTEHHVDERLPINGRRLTNVGLYRKYIEMYISAHPGIHKGMSLMVRQLAPNEHGLPLEIYCFANNTGWTEYEGPMADIFDHLLAVNTFFHIEVFESPAADDVRMAMRSIAERKG